MIWHSSEVSEVLKELSVDASKGLANGVADMRLKSYGRNAISNIEKPTFFRRFISQLNSKFVYLIIVISLLSFGVSVIYDDGRWYAPLLIILIVLIDAFLSAVNIYKSDTALDAMKSITNPTATVLRDGITRQIPSDELVPGDIILLKEGDYITADARVIEVNGFRCNEFNLSGINVPVEKKADVTVEDITPVTERINMVYSGCSVAHGTAKAVVVETGLNSELGHTSAIIQQTGADALPMQSAIDNTSRIVNIIILIACIIAFIISLIQNFRGSDPFATITVNTLLNSVVLGIAAIPESLPVIATMVVALGIKRIIRDDIIIKNPQALETLGNTTVICADKTGILTRNHMMLSLIYDGENTTDVEDEGPDERGSAVLRLAATCSTLENDPTENAIKDACLKYNSMSQTDVENVSPRLCVIPFDSERKTMTSINMISGKPVAIVKGAPEIVVAKCRGCDAEAIMKINDAMAADSLRVVCIAIKPLDEVPVNPSAEEIECDLNFVGLLGLIDPPRTDAIDGIKICDRAGIRTIMITGDNLVTATSVARRIGILKDGTAAITGAELSEMDDKTLAGEIEKYSVYARITPEDKMRIIKAWQARGETVAITGDSVCDADALAAADVGCTLGKRGADVAKGNADIIISNSNFISIVRAIRESRGLFENIKKSVTYLLSCNFGELLTYILGMFIFGMAPLTAVQLLWINLLTDCSSAVALSTESSEKDVMEKRGKLLHGSFLNLKGFLSIGVESLFIAAMSLLAFLIGRPAGYDVAMTMTFLTLGMIEVFHAFNVRTVRSVFTSKLNTNLSLLYSSVIIAFIICFLSLTPAGLIFGLKILTTKQFFISLGLSVAIIPFCEVYKLISKDKN